MRLNQRRDDIMTRTFNSEEDKKFPISQNNSYVQAMKALQEKIKRLEAERSLNLNSNEKNEREYLLADQIRHLKEEILSLKSTIQTLEKNQIQSSEMVTTLKEHNQQLQEERVIYLQQYKERYDKLHQQLDQQRSENVELDQINKDYETQLEQLRQQQRNQVAKFETQQSQEVHRLNSLINEMKTTEGNYLQQIRTLEKQVKLLQEEKRTLELEFINYKENVPVFRLQDLERQLLFAKNQLDEKEKYYLKRTEEIQSGSVKTQEQSNRRIQELVQKITELQNRINQLTYELGEAKSRTESANQIRAMKNSTLMSKSRNPISSNNDVVTILSDEDPVQPPVRRLNFESLSAPLTKHVSPRFKSEKRRDPSEVFSEHEESSNRRVGQRLKRTIEDNRNEEVEGQLRGLNSRYEILLKQASEEKNMAQRASIRKELLRLTEEIKRLNQQLYTRH